MMNRMWVMVAAVGFAAPEGAGKMVFSDDFAGHVRHIYRIK